MRILWFTALAALQSVRPSARASVVPLQTALGLKQHFSRVSALDRADSGFLIKAGEDSANTTMTDSNGKEAAAVFTHCLWDPEVRTSFFFGSK